MDFLEAGQLRRAQQARLRQGVLLRIGREHGGPAHHDALYVLAGDEVALGLQKAEEKRD